MENETRPELAEQQQELAAASGDRAAFLYAITAQTPWWIISVLTHCLIIALAGLVSMAIELPNNEEVRMETRIFKPEIPIIEPPRTEDPLKPRGFTYEPVPLEPGAQAEVLVPPDLHSLFEFGNMFATINKTYEVEGARGVPEARIVYSPEGVVDDPGGGGPGGFASCEEIIGWKGLVGFGEGGGRYGLNGSGIGPDSGPGKGTWGRWNAGYRKAMAIKFNPPDGSPTRVPWQVTEDAVQKALHWLAYHQEADGHWDAAKFGAAHKTDTACTAFALLAFLGCGHSERITSPYRDTVHHAITWLKSKQAPSGLIFDGTDENTHHRAIGYPHAIATLALTDALGNGALPETAAAAQRAIDYCTQTQQAGEGAERRGWRYAPKEEGDLSVSGWYIMALKSAKVGGLKVEPAALVGAIRFLDSVEAPAVGSDPGYPASRYKYRANDDHLDSAHRLTAIGALSRLFLGWRRDELQGSVDWFVNKGGLPTWGANGDKVDLYYWYYGTMAVFQESAQSAGGLFSRWNEAMKTALIPHQRPAGDESGSWDPTGEFAAEWGRVGQTALSALCLEVYYRHELLR